MSFNVCHVESTVKEIGKMKALFGVFVIVLILGLATSVVRAGGRSNYDMSEVEMSCKALSAQGMCVKWEFSGKMKGDDQGNGCFSGQMLVMEETLGPIAMADLQVGHSILGFDEFSNNVVYSKVTTFLHRAPFDLFHYIRISYGKDDDTIESTPTHNLAVNDAFDYQFAEDVKVGDRLYTNMMMYENVTEVRHTLEVGAYAPYTELGNYFVGSNPDNLILAHNLADIRNPSYFEGPIDMIVKLSSIVNTYVYTFGTDTPREFFHPVAELGRQLHISN